MEHQVFDYSHVDQFILDRCSQVCNGEGVEEATEYNQNQGIHPIVLLNYWGASHKYTHSLPRDWWPETISDVDLVVFIHFGLKQIEECGPYRASSKSDGIYLSYTREQHYLEIILREAKTAEILSSIILWGSMPDSCPPLLIYDYTGYEVGSYVTFDDLVDYLKQFVL